MDVDNTRRLQHHITIGWYLTFLCAAWLAVCDKKGATSVRNDVIACVCVALLIHRPGHRPSLHTAHRPRAIN